MGQYLYIVEDGGSRCGEPGYGLEIGVCDVGDATMNQKWEHTEEREDDPHRRHYHVGIMTAEAVLCLTSCQQEKESTAEGQQHRQKKCQRVVFVVIEGDGYTPSHEKGLDEKQ